jgi:hypothetical protein
MEMVQNLDAIFDKYNVEDIRPLVVAS